LFYIQPKPNLDAATFLLFLSHWAPDIHSRHRDVFRW